MCTHTHSGEHIKPTTSVKQHYSYINAIYIGTNQYRADIVMECEVYGWAKQCLTRIDEIEIKTSDERGERKKNKNKRKLCVDDTRLTGPLQLAR